MKEILLEWTYWIPILVSVGILLLRAQKILCNRHASTV